MKKALFFFIFFYIFTDTLLADTKKNNQHLGCSNQPTKNSNLNFYNSRIKKIEIDTHNYRSWTVNNIKIITSNTRFIPNNLKRRFDADIKVTYEDDFFCILKGKVRHSGDAKDHIALKDNSIIQSLDITLNHGNIRGITRFKLFKPDVRGVLEDVIIQTQILRDLGYLAPRSIKVNTRVNETESIMLFQEKAAKELLEFNNRREGPILEGDQKFFFELVKNIPDNNLSNWSVGTPILRTKSSKVMLSKLTNANLINKGDVHKQISLDAINKLNSIYLYWSNRFQDEKNNFYFFDYDLDNSLLALFDKDKLIKLEIYNLFMQSTNSHHALSGPNRKFYWNSIENYFEPIVYDANPDISRGYSTTTTSKIRFPISVFYDQAIETLDQKLSNISVEKLYNQTSFLGLNLSKDLIDRKINKIRNNLKIINENYIKIKQQDVMLHNQYKYKENILEQFNKNLKEINPATYLIKQNKSELLKCEIYLENCEFYDIPKADFIRLLEGELEINNTNYQYIGNNLDLKNLSLKDNYFSKKFSNTTIFYEKGIKLETDQDKNIISINQEEVGSRAYVINGSLNGTAIVFNGIEISKDENMIPKNYPIDIKGLTGCLSLINVDLKNINISASNSNCEDAVNIINSKGSVKKVFIKSSYSDGLDVDFSELKIDEIDISNASNDCADFSYGKYELANLIFNGCGDKAVSLGETSIVEINNIKVDQANTGIATKDSSILNLKEALLNNTDTCLAVYNKKQEFSGGFVEIKKIDCKNYLKKIDKDNLSKIIFFKDNKI